MALLMCADCNEKVSSNAMTCVHCGNLLREHRPGIIGGVLRVFYGMFCLALFLLGALAVKEGVTGAARPSDVMLVPLVCFGIWFAGSVAVAVLLYVTRQGSIARVGGSLRHHPGQS